MTPRILSFAAVAALVLSWFWLPEHNITLLSYIGLYSLVVAGLVVLTGIGGMTSFGQAAFMGLGAYSTAWVCTSPTALALLSGMPAQSLPWFGLVVGLLVTFAVAWALGSVTLKLSGHYLPLCTIAWGLSLYFLFGNLEWLGGHTGRSGIPALQMGGLVLNTPRELGLVIWAVLLLSMWAVSNLLDSREGRAIRSLKSNRLMAESMGINTSLYRVKVFVLAALLAAISGWFYAHLQRFINPTPFSLSIGIEFLFMVVVGGSGYLWGAILGATLITLLKSYLQDILPQLLGATGNFETIAFGLLMLWVLQRYPEGLWPSLAGMVNRVMRKPPPPTATKAGATLNLPKAVLPALGTQVLQASVVSKSFGGLIANNQVSMDVKAGEVHALIGPNGAGKSTFFNMISGVDTPSAGVVKVMDQAMTGKPSREFARLGMGRTFQHVRLLGTRSVLDNVVIGAHRWGRCGWIASMLRLDRKEEASLRTLAMNQLERCGLADMAQTQAASLALGQQRIVEIARALAGQPTVLLLDEPAAGLRHLEKKALAQLLDKLRSEGVGILVVEHDMEFVMGLADRITVLEFGSVIARGTPAEIQNNPRVLEAYLGGSDDEMENGA
jgi:branched-chain amino acid transport system permease protein